MFKTTVKVLPEHLVTEGEETRLQAWDPMVGHLITTAKMWDGKRFGQMSIVDRGFEDLWELAECYRDRAFQDARINELADLIKSRLELNAVVEGGEIGYGNHVHIELHCSHPHCHYLMIGFDVDNVTSRINGYISLVFTEDGYGVFDAVKYAADHYKAWADTNPL
jgi:hypothetical protein